MSEAGSGSNKPAAEPMAVAARPTLMGALRVALSSWWGPGPVRALHDSSDELAKDRTDMAAERTLMAADRTLMAWVRTSLSMNSFGFTIYKVLEGFLQSGSILPRSETPRDMGLFLTGLGTVAMVMGTVEYVQTLRELHTMKEVRLRRPAFLMALLMSVMGVVLFLSIVTKLF
jgi:putative membrane protein